MKELKILQNKGYKFSTDGKSIKFRATEDITDTYYTNKLLNKLKSNKNLVIYLLKDDLCSDNPKVIAVDIETNGEEIVLVSWSDGEEAKASQDLDDVAELLEDKNIRKVFHNAQFDVTKLENAGYKVNNYFDTMVMSQIYHNRVRSENSLKDCAYEFLGIEMEKSLQNKDNWNDTITEEHIEYCKKDSEITFKLYRILIDKIEDLYLEEVMYREMATLPAVIELSRNGIRFDYDSWKEDLKELTTEKDDLEEVILECFDSPDLNLNSPEQLKEALATIDVVVTSTADEVLAKVEGQDTVITKIRRYKKLKSILNRYGEKLESKMVEGKIYSNWRLIGADTGRMTCKGENIQGFPRVSKKHFKPAIGCKFIVADYSQIELRILAELSGDKTMMECIKEGVDLHRKTATAIMNKSIDDITDTERKIAKTINFGIVYGMTAYGIRNRIKAECNIDLTIEEAGEFRSAYFDLYPGILKFQDRMLKARSISTQGGRHWDKTTTELDKGDIKRFNYPIQASAAEGFKEAVILLMERKRASWRIVAAVHDEILLEVPEGDVTEGRMILESSMIEGMEKLFTEVPIEVDVNVGDYWVK